MFTEGSSTFSWKSEGWDLPKPKNKYPPVTFHILNSDPGLGVLPPLGGSPCPKESDQQLWLVASQEPWHPEDSAVPLSPSKASGPLLPWLPVSPSHHHNALTSLAAPV